MIEAIRRGLAAAGNPDKAGPMQAYVKSELPCHGVKVPEVRRITSAKVSDHPITDRAVWETTVRALFDQAEYREERYAAIALTGHRLYRTWQDPAAIALYRHMIAVGAWWDLVDEIAIHRIGPILRSNHTDVRPVLFDWASDDNIWIRRTAIIAQVGSKDETDEHLLTSSIELSIGSSEFFLRKAIGWALRAYSKTDPAWVTSFVDAHEDELSGLSKREATKHLVGL